MKKNKDLYNTFLYFISEGISKGGSYLLLLFVGIFLDNELYLKLFLLLSLEVVITMTYISYYSEIMLSYNINEKDFKKDFFNASYFFSITQLIIYILLYMVFFRDIFKAFYGYKNIWIVIVILLNGFIINIIRLYAVYFQLIGNHNKAVIFRSLPFALASFISILFFYFGNDKILSFFLGKFVGLFLFFIIICTYYKEKVSFIISKKKLLVLKNIIQKSKYSMLLTIFSWCSGMGFPTIINNIAPQQALKIGYIVNIFSLLQFFSYGINQVYVANLKTSYEQSTDTAVKLTQKYHKIYIGITIIMLLFCFIPFGEILQFGNINKWIIIFPYAIIIFFLNTFHWVSTPYYHIRGNFKQLFLINVFANLLGWIFIVALYYIMNIRYFTIHYLILWGFMTLIPYFKIRKSLCTKK